MEPKSRIFKYECHDEEGFRDYTNAFETELELDTMDVIRDTKNVEISMYFVRDEYRALSMFSR